MRIDHHAYQRAARVAGFGLLLQLVIGTVLLIFGITAPTDLLALPGQTPPTGDTAFRFAAYYVLSGTIVWLALIVLFYQHKLERLESLEEDELTATRGDATSIFDSDTDEVRVAARRLRNMYRWLMPAVSLVLALTLSGLAWRMFSFFSRLGREEGGTQFLMTNSLGWSIAICLSFALVCFIFSRFVAGMAKHPAWQNLRGGASYIVGSALVLLAVAAGIVFRFFDNDQALNIVARAIPWFLLVVALEVALNFVLNLYRPRIPGETPRPAFDSKLLSLAAAPDSLVRTLNEAVNYQFGFDVTSTWGYQLLLRSFAWLIALAVGALVLLNTMVIVEPHQQAVKLRGGRIMSEQPYTSGVMWKLPWPFESAQVFDVSRVRELPLTARRAPVRRIYFPWHESDVSNLYQTEIEPFIVGATELDPSRLDVRELDRDLEQATILEGDEQPAPVEREVARRYSLVDAEIILQYRVREGGLLDYLNFAPDTIGPRRRYTDRERALRNVALEAVSRYLATLSLDEAISHGRAAMGEQLVGAIQTAFDDPRRPTGVEVVAVSVPMMRPSGNAAEAFEELTISHQTARQRIVLAERNVVTTYAALIGDVSKAEDVLEGIDRYNDLLTEGTPEAAEEAEELRIEIERMLREGGGMASQMIARAERDRWVSIMGAQSQAAHTRGEAIAFHAAPELYKQRKIMNTFAGLATLRKYILTVDPERVNIGFDMIEVNPILGNVSDTVDPESATLESAR